MIFLLTCFHLENKWFDFFSKIFLDAIDASITSTGEKIKNKMNMMPKTSMMMAGMFFKAHHFKMFFFDKLCFTTDAMWPKHIQKVYVIIIVIIKYIILFLCKQK